MSNDIKELTPEEIADREAYEAGAYARAYTDVERNRQAAYQSESDPLFFTYQRNENGATKQQWLDKVAEIKERYPYPEQTED
jgi:hypothetical protein